MNTDGRHDHDPHQPADQFWERRYQEKDRIWSGRVNQTLADTAAELEVGSALDLGCGEGGDTVWLAGMGWRVTATDISGTALERAARSAAEHGVDSRVTFEQCDLSTDFPSGTFDLVSAHYLHSPVDFPRTKVLQRAARAVALGGRLLIVDHAAPPPWAPPDHDHPDFPTLDETFESLELHADYWRIDRLESAEREATGPDGVRGTLRDNIILACRLA